MPQDDLDVVVKVKSDPRGVTKPDIVRSIASAVITVSVVACTVLCILAMSAEGSSISPTTIAGRR